MPHDPRNPKGIFTAAQGIGCETVPGLFHFPVVQTSFFQGGYPYAPPQIAGIDHGSGWRTEINFPWIVSYIFFCASKTNTLLTVLLLMVFFGILEFGWSLAGSNPPAFGS